MDTSGDESGDENPAVFKVTPGLPQCHEFTASEAFIRDCYLEYYDMLVTLMGTSAKYFTLTGTPGIGKSVFYMYFFGRYTSEFPDEDIVLASFTAGRLRECKLWNADSKTLEDCTEVPKGIKIHLYDGVPDVHPTGNFKMICFTSPNPLYFQDMVKFTDTHRIRYMPNWTFLEQLRARDVLKIEGLEDTSIKKRWNYFGGTVRYTLTMDRETLNEGVGTIQDAINSLTTVSQILDCFNGLGDQRKVVHRLLHYENQTVYGVRPKLKPGSKYLAWQMHRHLEDKLDSDRDKLMRWLDGAGKASPFYGWLFENLAHERFLQGLTLEARILDTEQEEAMSFEETVGCYTRFKMESTDHVFEYAYRMPDASNLRSIDSYYLTETQLFLIQITRNMDHHVDVEGIFDILKKLEWLDKFVQDPSLVKLIFVVPKPLVRDFPLQKFKTNVDFGSEDISTLPCEKVPGIGDSLRDHLASRGIHSVGQLRDAKAQNPSSISRVRSVLAAFEENLALVEHQDAIKSITQYVAGLDVPFASKEDDGIENML